MAKQMTVTIDEAVGVFLALGFSNADKWRAEPNRLQTKLDTIRSLTDATTKLEDAGQQALLDQMLAADKITLSGADAPAAAAPAAAPVAAPAAAAPVAAPAARATRKKTATAAPAAAAPKAAKAAKASKPAKAAKAAKATKATKAAKPAKAAKATKAAKAVKPPKAPKPPKPEKTHTGVRPEAETSYSIAGRVVVAHGMGKGVTDAMVADFEKQYGKKNEVRSKLILSRTWHVLHAAGYADA